MPSGDVNLTWTIPPDPGNTFVSYHIYRIGSGQVGSVFSRLTNSFTDIGANAHLQSYCYYIETESFTGVTVVTPSMDTLCTMYLNVTNPGTSVAQLSWNAPRTPLLPSMNSWYKIYRDYPLLGTFVDSTQTLSYNDTVIVCNEFINYSIELSDNLPCQSISNTDGDLFKDNTVPVTPGIDSVSVNAFNNAIIGWGTSLSGDVNAYVIYQFINSVWVPIDTVYGFGNTFYGNPNSSADIQSEWYSISAMDSCGNLSPLGTYHNSIYLTVTIDPCARTANLNWNNYINWSGGVSGYEVWVSVDGGPNTLLSTNSSTQLSYVHPGLNSGSNYCYFIRARQQSGTSTSTSNRKCVFAALPVMPVYTYGITSTVLAPGYVHIDGAVDNNASTSEFRFERADAPAGPFVTVGTKLFTGSPLTWFDDMTALTEKQSHYYRILTIDSCAGVSQISNTMRTIFAQAIPNNDMTNTLSWNDYEGFDAGVQDYDIYRSIDGSPFTMIGNVGFGTNTYVDDASPFLSGSGRFEYYVVARENVPNQYVVGAQYSNSNIAEVMQPAKFFVPNAFVPGGVNTIFIPVGAFYDKSEYSLSIFNRFGDEIFETGDPFTGWDGALNGKVCQQGVYVWFIKYKDSAGKYTETQGTVTLIGK